MKRIRLRWILFAVLLVFFLFYSRLRLHSPYLFTWDSVNYALCLEHFDIRLHRPHPPGNLLYCYTLRLLKGIVHDANLAMILFNIIATSGACLFITLLVLELIHSRESDPSSHSLRNFFLGAGAATIYATNPISWFYGCIAEIYPVEGFFASCVCYLVIASYRKQSLLSWASLIMAIAGGFRPTTEVFLFPFYLAGFLRKDSKTIAVSLLLLLIGNAIWFSILVALSGGLSEYLHVVQLQSVRSASKTSVFMKTEEDRATAGIFSIPVLLVQACTLPLLLGLVLRFYRIRLRSKEALLLSLPIPALLFFFLVYFAKDGYLLLILPALIAFCVVQFATCYKSKLWIGTAIVLACLINSGIFLTSVARPEKKTGKSFHAWLKDEMTSPNKDQIAERVNFYRDFFAFVDHLRPGKKKIFITNYKPYPNSRTIIYYYPEEEVLAIRRENLARFFHQHSAQLAVGPIRIGDRLLITIGRKDPEIPMRFFSIKKERYYFADADELPRRFRIYNFDFYRVVKKQQTR